MPAPDYTFDLDAGRLCLDFVNTRSSSGEHLNDYADLVAFVLQSGLLTRSDADWLRAEARRDPGPAGGVLVRARRLRESLRAIFGALAQNKRPREGELGALNGELANAMPHALVLPAGASYTWTFSGRNFDAPLWPIARSAAELLTSDSERPLVRECGASDCQWLFLDTSKNRTRQWCSMQSCGNREKARRHYQRLRQRRSAAGAPRSGDAHPAAARGRRSAAAPADDASATAE